MSALLPVAEQMLSEHGELQPFGGSMSRDGEIVQVGGWQPDAYSSPAELIAEFEASFRDGAGRGELKATALLYSSPEKDSVAVRLDHREQYSLVVTFPYRFSPGGELVIDEPFAAEGSHAIFE